MGEIYGTLSNANNVTVERFIPGHRAWRLMGVPLASSGAPTINASWQEGGIVATIGGTSNPHPGYGTDITGGTVSHGFDQNPKGNPSLDIYDTTTDEWKGIPNTNSTHVSDYAGYMLFVRGSRANDLAAGIYAPVDNTVLRATGQLDTGKQTFTSASAQFKLFTNPYACTIDFATTTKTNLPDTYYLWDPLLTGSEEVGAFVTLTRHGSGYIAAPNPVSPIDLNGSIESGAAFLVHFSGAGSLQIHESDKTSTSADVFRPATGGSESDALLRIDLYNVNSNSSITLLDGVLSMYNPSYSNFVDNEDALKYGNSTEEISIQQHDTSLAIEARQSIAAIDTLLFRLSNLQLIEYRLVITATALNHPGATAFLQDNYLNTQTPINLSGITNVNFYVTSNSNSYSANRFKIIFGGSSVLPITFSSVNGARQNDAIALQWDINNALNTSHYQVQKSSDGINFNSIDSINTIVNTTNYQYVDNNPFNGNNFYRIKAVETDGNTILSKIVNVPFDNNADDNISFNNPVISNTIDLQLKNLPVGMYDIRFINNSGQGIFEKKINRLFVTDSHTIQLPANIAKGILQMEILGQGLNPISKQVIIE